MAIIAPFDLQFIFLNVVAGSSLIFAGISLLAIAMFAGKMRMPNAIFGMMIALFGILLMNVLGWFYILIMIIAGILTGYTLSRFQR